MVINEHIVGVVMMMLILGLFPPATNAIKALNNDKRKEDEASNFIVTYPRVNDRHEHDTSTPLDVIVNIKERLWDSTSDTDSHEDKLMDTAIIPTTYNDTVTVFDHMSMSLKTVDVDTSIRDQSESDDRFQMNRRLQSVSMTISKDVYYVGEDIVCNIASPTELQVIIIDDLGGPFRIVKTTELSQVLSTATNYYRGAITKIVNHSYAIMSFNPYYELLLGGEFWSPLYNDVKTTNVTIIDWDNIGTFNLVFLSADRTKVLSTSDPFRITIPNVVLNVKNEYYPGDTVLLNISAEAWSASDYIKVFEVTESFQEEPTKFNNATYIVARQLDYDRHFVIKWTRPGLYQIVYFSGYNQVVKSISNVFHVLRTTNETKPKIAVAPNSTYYPGQKIRLFITGGPGRTLFNTNFIISFVPATVSVSSSTFDLSTLINSQYFRWDSSSITMEFNPKIEWLRTGFYKAVIFSGSNAAFDTGSPYDFFRFGVSKAFRVTKAMINVQMKNRTWTQGESVSLGLYNPFNFYLSSMIEYAYYTFHIIPAIPTKWDVQTMKHYEVPVPTNLIVLLQPGFYRFALFYNEYSEIGYSTTYLYSIPNSSFRVVRK
jgi:hypothetical protein